MNYTCEMTMTDGETERKALFRNAASDILTVETIRRIPGGIEYVYDMGCSEEEAVSIFVRDS